MEDLFRALVFLWAMVGLFVIVQGFIWLQEKLSQPKVWKWRRK